MLAKLEQFRAQNKCHASQMLKENGSMKYFLIIFVTLSLFPHYLFADLSNKNLTAFEMTRENPDPSFYAKAQKLKNSQLYELDIKLEKSILVSQAKTIEVGIISSKRPEPDILRICFLTNEKRDYC